MRRYWISTFLIFCPLPIGRKLCRERTLQVGWGHQGSRFCWKMFFNPLCRLPHNARPPLQKPWGSGSMEIQLFSSGRWRLCGGLQPPDMGRSRASRRYADSRTRSTSLPGLWELGTWRWGGMRLSTAYNKTNRNGERMEPMLVQQWLTGGLCFRHWARFPDDLKIHDGDDDDAIRAFTPAGAMRKLLQ